jgi:membrane protein CcdC involved in cytochrome C biogenesis
VNTPLLFGGLATAVGTTAILLWRIREGQTPVRKGKIIAPPLGMSTGFCMFFSQRFQVPLAWAGVAFLLGALVFAWPLIYTSRLRKDENGQVWMKRSPIFFFMLLLLVAVRFGLRSYVEHFISYWQTGGLAFILAFGMIIHWRIRMLFDFNKLKNG